MMKALLEAISIGAPSEKGRNYRARILVDGVAKSYSFTASDKALTDLDADPEFDNDFLRYHVRIGVKIMDLICDLDRGESVCLPQEFSDTVK